MTRPKTKCTFDVLLRFVAGFLMPCQNSYIWCIITRKSRFSHDVPKRCKFVALLRGKAGFLMTQPKAKCTFDALLRFVAGFLMTHQNLLYLIHYNVEKQGFSWRTKTCKFTALLRGKAGIPMTRQKLLYLIHYFVEKQVSWCNRKQSAHLMHYYVS